MSLWNLINAMSITASRTDYIFGRLFYKEIIRMNNGVVRINISSTPKTHEREISLLGNTTDNCFEIMFNPSFISLKDIDRTHLEDIMIDWIGSFPMADARCNWKLNSILIVLSDNYEFPEFENIISFKNPKNNEMEVMKTDYPMFEFCNTEFSLNQQLCMEENKFYFRPSLEKNWEPLFSLEKISNNYANLILNIHKTPNGFYIKSMNQNSEFEERQLLQSLTLLWNYFYNMPQQIKTGSNSPLEIVLSQKNYRENVIVERIYNDSFSKEELLQLIPTLRKEFGLSEKYDFNFITNYMFI